MIDSAHLRKAWGLLDARERRNALKVLALMLASALASAGMIGSVFPFLSVLSDPSLIETSRQLAWIYAAGGFSSDYSFLIALGLGALAIIAGANVLQLANTWAMTRFAEMRAYTLSRRLLGHYLAQPYDFFLDRHSGDMATNILGEASVVVGGFMRPFAGLLSAGLTILAVIAMLVTINPVVAITAIGTFSALYAVAMLLVRGSIRAMGQRRAQAAKTRFRATSEALSGVKDIKLLGHEATYLDRFSAPSLDLARLNTNVTVLGQAPSSVLQIVAFGTIIVLCLALLDSAQLHDRAALGGILPLLGILAFAGQRLMPQLQAVYGAIIQMAYSTAALDRVYDDLIADQRRPLDRSRPAPLGLNQDLTVNGVSYTYPNADRPNLSDIHLRVEAGERIGIVGASGAGKTTLADIILGLLTPQTGTIRADGTEITPQNLRAWQRSVGYVPQDIFLIDASLSENIALGLTLDEIDAEKVERCAHIAQLHDFITTDLPNGYATHIGERGVRLSGGQRQRIGIARALYHDADLIVFDEATSALDNLTEREVMAAIEALPGDKTILMIAHRLSTVKVCDRIVVMQDGTIVGYDRWEALLETNAVFQRIARAA